MARRFLLVLLFVVLTFDVHAQRRRAVAPPLSDAGWIAQHAIPFATTDARSGITDLEPFGALAGAARIVALGEATHGTHEFQTMKHRLLEFLVREKGFTIFAYESDFANALLIDRYIKTGAPDPQDALRAQALWPWQTAEFLDLIHWMREYNQTRGSAPELSFAGFDMQFSAQAITDVLAFLGKVDPAAASAAEQDYACWTPYANGLFAAFQQKPLATRQQCAATADAWIARIEGKKDAYAAASSARAVDVAVEEARVIHMAIQNNTITDPDGVYRDQSMAEIVGWIADHAPGEKLVLWAHNYHVGTEFGNEMGGLLRDRFGAAYVNLGFDFHGGTYTAISSETHQFCACSISAPAPDSYETFFHAAGIPRFMLDLRTLPAGDRRTQFLDGPRPMFGPGAVSAPEYESYPTPLRKTFDILVWIERSTPTTLLFR